MHFNDRSSTLLCHCSWTFILSRSWTAKKSTPPTISLVEWIFFAVHERAFYGPLWTKSLAKSLFLVVHERLYGIVHQHAFIPRCWTHPNSLADYLGRRAFDATFSVSPHFFNYSWIIMMPKIFSRDKLSPETHCVYVFVICWPLKNLEISISHKQSKEKKVFTEILFTLFIQLLLLKL